MYVVALEPEAYFKVLEFLLSEETNRNRNRPEITTTPSAKRLRAFGATFGVSLKFLGMIFDSTRDI
jgi:hypothetical protein